MLRTGRMALMLKTGVKAFSSAGWVGSEQFTSAAPDRTGHTEIRGWTHLELIMLMGNFILDLIAYVECNHRFPYWL